MSFFCLSKYSYVRCVNNYAYIANQSTGKQLIYDANGMVFANLLTHIPQETETVVKKLCELYDDVDISVLRSDFIDFLNVLADEGFVILGTNFAEVLTNSNEKIDFKMDVPSITDLTIEVTNRCNERCVHCYLPNKLKDKGMMMNLNVIKTIVNEFAELGGKTVTLTGGEVMLHKDFEKILHYIHDKHLQIIIYSNLTTLSETILQKLKETEVSFVQVSVYGVNPLVHDSITGMKGSCVRSMHSMEMLKKAEIPLRIVCPVMKENRKDIVNVLKYAKKTDVPIELELNITPREDRSNDNLEHRLSINEMETLLKELVDYDKEYMENLLHRHKYKYDKRFNFAEYLNYPVCTAGQYGLYVTADGKITTCPNMQGNPVSSIDMSSLKSIWYDNENIMALRKTTEGSFEKCVNCEASDYCFRCFARNYTETGNYMTCPEYACEMAFLAKKIVDNLKTS